jgi:predicted O-methyltransferase YrrM
VRNSLLNPPVRDVLGRLFAAAEEGDDAELARITVSHGTDVQLTLSAAEKARAFGALYIPVSPECGRLLYSLVRTARPETVVEFGTSFGISTIYLAAAVADNATGQVISAELNQEKAAAAAANLAQAGLGGAVEIVTGDARETLALVPGPIGFVLLDGWKESYLEMLRILEPRLAPGAMVVADDTGSFASMLGDYLGYVRDEANGYVSVAFPVGDGVEVSCRA